MDYFQELLQSYQKIKKRKFSIMLISEQAALNPNATIEDALGRAQATAATTANPEPYSGDIGVYKSTSKSNPSYGLITLSRKPIPGGTQGSPFINFNQIAKLNPEARQKIESMMRGQQDSEDPAQNQPNQAQVDSMGQPILSPEQQLEQQFQESILTANKDVISLVNDGFFVSVGNSMPKWMRDSFELKKYFAGESWSLESKLQNGKDQKDTPLTLEQQKEASQTFSRFLSIAKKVNSGIVTESDIQWVKDHISTGSTSEDKRSIRIKSDSSDLAVSFKWSKGKGIGKDTQLWRHLIDSYDKKMEDWATRQVPERNAEELKIPRDRFTMGTASTGQLAAIQGFFSEEFVEIGTLLGQAAKLARAEPTRAAAYRKQAIKLFETSYNKNKEGLLKAFNAYEAYQQGNIVVTDEALAELGDFADIAKELNIGIREAALVGLTPEQKAVLADTFTMEAAKALIQLDSQFAYKMKADFVVRLGTSKRNGKKTDLMFVYKTEAEAVSALKRMGLSDKKIQEFLLSSRDAKTLYQDPELNKFLDKAGPESVAVPVGIKTYTKAKGVKLGTASFGSILKTLFGKTTDPELLGQSNSIIRQLKKTHSAQAYAGHVANMEKLAGLSKTMDKLLWDGESPEISKSTLKIVKEVLASKSRKESDEFMAKLSAYETDPETNLDFRHDLNKYIEEEKRSRILGAMSSGMKGSNKESWLCTLEAFTMATASAAEKNQLTVSRFIQGRESRVMDHNSSYEQIFDGIRKGFIGVTAEGGSLKFICKGKSKLCDADHYGSLSMSEGKFNFELNLASVRRHDSELIQKLGEGVINTDIFNLLLEQRNLINTLLAKYQ